MGHLSHEDRVAAEAAIKANALTDVMPAKLPRIANLITCSDGHQFREEFGHLLRCLSAGPDLTLHVVAVAGGPLCLPKDSPLSSLDDIAVEFFTEVRAVADDSSYSPLIHSTRIDLTLLFNIWAARKLKGIEATFLYSHSPCGAAGICGLSFQRQQTLLHAAKDRIRSLFPWSRVFCFTHIDWEDGRKRTYHSPGKRTRMWASPQRQIEL